MAKGKINVSVENIFPLIKKFLYSDQEIFLRELISNATDATLKLKHMSNIGEFKQDFGSPIIEVKIDKKNSKIHIIDQGVGMTENEVKKYINEVAFSGAEEFIEKYKDTAKDSGIIGHFGLGFYSAFMVSDSVEIITKSFKKSPAVHWSCDGSPEFTLVKSDKKDRGTEIILNISKDSKSFLDDSTITELLKKYNRFMPIPIKFGTKEITKKTGEGEKEKEVKETVDNIINITEPAWTKKPKDLKEDDYKTFYKDLYPMNFEDPLFNIHLNVDYPFNLTGILYFPKITNDINLQKDKIQLYQNQVFVTDNVEGIVPEFLTLLRGVIDSPDIPLNVSRSYLQVDSAVKKISNYITRKVADKLNSLFKEDRKKFEEKWNDIKVIIEYGMLSEDKFYEKSDAFALYPSTDNKFFTYDELLKKIKRDLTNELGLKDSQVKLTGLLVLYNNVLESLITSQILTIGFVFAAIMVMFLLLFRSIKFAIIAVIPSIIASSSVLGLMGLMNIPLDIMTITIAAICIGIGVDHSIHYVHRFREEMIDNTDQSLAIKKAHNSTGQAIYFTSVIIILGFSILAFSNFIPTIYFGLFTAFAMLLALFANLTLLPVLLMKLR